MTQLTTTVHLNPPPPALMRLVNPAVRRVLSTPVVAKRIGKIALVEFSGRRSGRRLRIPMGLHDIDGVPTAFTSRPWRLNFIERAPVTVTRRGRPLPGTALLSIRPHDRSARRCVTPSTAVPPRSISD